MNVRMTLALAAACSLPIAAFADDADAKLLKSFVSSQTAAVATLDLSASDLGKAVSAVLPFVPDQQTAERIGSTIEKLRSAEVKRVYVVVSPESLLSNEWVFALVATSPERAPAVRAAFPTLPGMTVAAKDGAVFFGASAVWERLQQPSTADEAANLLARLERSKPSPLSIVARLPEAHRSALAEFAPRLPSSLGSGATAPLLEAFDAIEMNATAGDRPSISIVVHARDAAGAKLLEGLATKGLSLVQTAPAGGIPAEKAARSLAAKLKPTVVENRVELSINLANAGMQEALKGLADAAGENARRQTIVNDLKMIAVAMHNYHDAYKSFPPGSTVDKNGKPLLSWRVHILPFLDHNALYRKFKLDEPWDSEDNRKLVDQMPDVYRAFGSSSKAGKTSILGFAGSGGIFPRPGETVRINDIKDGSSNTIMCIAAPASQAVDWTKPDDLSLGDADLLSKVGAPVILAAYCDGSVHSIPLPAAIKGLLPYITINGREPIGN